MPLKWLHFTRIFESYVVGPMKTFGGAIRVAKLVFRVSFKDGQQQHLVLANIGIQQQLLRFLTLSKLLLTLPVRPSCKQVGQ